MSLALYAIGEDRHGPLEELTVEQTRMRTLAADGLVMFVAEQAVADVSTDEQALWRYERIVEELMKRQPILPARYGTALADERAARAALRERREELTRALHEVADAVELAVRATWSDPSAYARTPSSGREYLLGRLQAQREAQRIAERLDPLRSLARRSLVRVLPRPSMPLLAAYLVERDAVTSFDECFRSLSAAVDGAELSCTGPWPPYSFAEGGAT